MAEYYQVGRGGSNEGWFIEKSTADLVYMDTSGNVRFRIDNATGNVTVPGTLGVTGAATFVGDVGALVATTLSTSGTTTTSRGVGAVAAEGTIGSERGHDGDHLTKLTFSQTTSAAGAALADGARCYTFPNVPVIVRGVYVTATLTAATETGTPEIGVGTTRGNGANATLGAVGAAAENIIEGTASEAFASGGTSAARNTIASVTPVFLPASSVLHVNYALGYTASEDVTVAGTVWIDWCELS